MPKTLTTRLDQYDKRIIHFLGHRGPSNTNYIAEELEISWATVLSHLKRLKIKGFVDYERKGETMIWKLNY